MVDLDPHGVNERLKERERNGDCQQEHLRIKNVSGVKVRMFRIYLLLNTTCRIKNATL